MGRSFSQGTFTSMVTGSGVVTVMFEITADENGKFSLAGVKGDAGAIKKIITNETNPGPPDGVFFVVLNFNAVRFLYVNGNMLHETSAAGSLVTGPTFASGAFDEFTASATFAYVEGGVNVLPAPGTRFVCRMDIQTENWGTR